VEFGPHTDKNVSDGYALLAHDTENVVLNRVYDYAKTENT
jgi:hypothetical protein